MFSRSIVALAMTLFISSPALAQTSIYQPNQTDLDFLTTPSTNTGGDPDREVITGTAAQPESDTGSSGEKGGTEDINIGVGELEQKGNVEYEWKVEEGESATGAGSSQPQSGDIKTNDMKGIEPDEIDFMDDGEPITPDFGILLGGGSDDDEEGEAGREQAENILLQGAQEADVPMESISLNYEKITTKVKQSVKLFGIIPVAATATVEIDAEQQVKVRFPWWAFLASGRDSEALGEKVFTTLSNVLKTKHDTIKNAINNVR